MRFTFLDIFRQTKRRDNNDSGAANPEKAK